MIIYTEHCRQRMGQRKVEPVDIEKVLMNPDKTYLQPLEKVVALKYSYQRKRTLKVVYREVNEDYLIITVRWLSRRG